MKNLILIKHAVLTKIRYRKNLIAYYYDDKCNGHKRRYYMEGKYSFNITERLFLDVDYTDKKLIKKSPHFYVLCLVYSNRHKSRCKF